MTYQALARKWRPRRFSELVGQAHVVRALSNALSEQKLHQAILFAGTRGVGKTTLARIVAKCLNCEHGIAAEPCTEELCSACAEIDQGRFVDLIEVDAASRTGVDDTRDLMDNVAYAPTRGRRKVYLIDEVHMLSRHAFNALLKTLEEPPPHVQFVLATTDPQKIPVTILSRCLQFPLKRLPPREIGEQIDRILAAEQITAEAGAVAAIAQAADGSMRDGLSLLDQAVAFGGGQLTENEVHDMLGTVAASSVTAVLEAIAAADAQALMTAIERLDDSAPDYETVHDALAAALHRIAVIQLVPDAAAENEQMLTALSAGMVVADVQLYYDIVLAGKRDLDWAPDPRSGFEMTCLRMLAFQPLDAPAPGAGNTAGPTAAGAGSASDKPSVGQSVSPAINEALPPSADTAKTTAQAPPEDWNALVARLPLSGMAAELARNCVCHQLAAGQVELELSARLEHLRTERAVEQLQRALRTTLDPELSLQLRLGAGEGDSPAQRAQTQDSARREAAADAITNDPQVHALQQRLGAKLKADSIEPYDD